MSVSYKSNKGLSWLSYLSNILSPHWPKSGGSKIFFVRSARKIPPPTFKTVAPTLDVELYSNPVHSITSLASHADKLSSSFSLEILDCPQRAQTPPNPSHCRPAVPEYKKWRNAVSDKAARCSVAPGEWQCIIKIVYASVKEIGVYDEHLSWDNHIQDVACKVSRNVGILRKLKFTLPQTCLLLLYNSLVLPYLHYCSIIWN